MSLASLYPPRIDKTYQDAFLYTDRSFRVYFALPIYNSLDDINKQLVQVSIVNQKTGKSLVKNLSGVLLKSLGQDKSKTNDDNYFVTVNVDDLVDNSSFSTDIYYQIQLRFTSSKNIINETSVLDPYSYQINYSNVKSWLALNIDNFSEWSKITLGKAIGVPVFQMTGFEEEQSIVLDTNEYTVVGSVNFVEKDQKQDTSATVLNNYSVYLIDLDTNQEYYSNTLYPGGVGGNNILYEIPFLLTNNHHYGFLVEYETEEGYKGSSALYQIEIKLGDNQVFFGNIIATPSEEDAQIRIDVNADKEMDGVLHIRRAAASTNFETWEPIAHIELNGAYGIYWIDSLIDSGEWYLYNMQLEYYDDVKIYNDKDEVVDIVTKKVWTRPVTIEQPVTIDMDDSYLISNYTQLKIKLNPQVSSFKRVVKDSTTETLGSKYPFINRNGQVGYRTFPISGTIAKAMDDNNVFNSKKDMFTSKHDELTNVYARAVYEKQAIGQIDYLLERRFRETVMDYLYSGAAFLFKSPTEGNIIVKLTDISFTPNRTLGRMIYDFNATVTEIDEYTIKNCDLYKIQKCNLDISYVWVLISETYEKLENKVGLNSGVGFADNGAKKRPNLILTRDRFEQVNRNYGFNDYTPDIFKAQEFFAKDTGVVTNLN